MYSQNNFVPVSIRGFPSSVCFVSYSDAESEMRKQGILVNLNTENSLKVIVSQKMAEYYGCKPRKITRIQAEAAPSNSMLALSWVAHEEEALRKKK